VFRAAFAETPNHCRIIRLEKSNLYARIEPMNLSRAKLQQTSYHLCAYFKINRFDELNSTNIRRLP